MAEDKPTHRPPPQPPPWKSEEWISFFKAIEPYADKYLQFIREREEAEHRLTRLGLTHDWRIAGVSLAFLGAMVGLMSWLTSLGRVNGDALLFLAGTVTGYIFSLIVKFRWAGTVADEENSQ